MKETLIIFLFFAIVTLSCRNSSDGNGAQQKDATKQDKYENYINIKFQKEIAESKWILYCKNMQTKYKSIQSARIKNFGELSLQIQKIEVRHDTIDVNLCFSDEGVPILPGLASSTIFTGVGYKIGSDAPFAIIPYLNHEYRWGYGFVSQPILEKDDTDYIVRNASLLNQWFRSEAIKRGL